MRRLVLNWQSGTPEEVFRLGSTEGVVCPRLQDLDLRANLDTLPFYRLLLSPKLTSLSLTYSSSFIELEPLEEELPIIQPVIMGLDTFPLQRLRLRLNISRAAGRQMEPVISSAVLRCGPALKNLAIFSPLSDAAVQHICNFPILTRGTQRVGHQGHPICPCPTSFPD